MEEYVYKKRRLMEVIYGGHYQKYLQCADENGKYRDDRGVFVATYEQVLEMLDAVVLASDNNLLHVALNNQITKERAILDSIIKVFE